MSDQDTENRGKIGGNENRKLRSIISQVVAAMGKNFILYAIGVTGGFTTVLIGNVHNAPEDAPLSLTDEDVSWLGSINLITNPIGCVLSGVMSNKFGRKCSMQLLTIPMLCYWLIYNYATSAMMLLTGVALSGLTAGLLQAALPYISEISEPYLRGFLSAMSSLSYIGGTFTSYLLGSFFDWKTITLIGAGVPILCFLMLFVVPESPHWLMSKQRFEDTEKVLCWLRGWTTKENIQDEYKQLAEAIKSEDKTEKNMRTSCCSIKLYLRRTFIFPFLLMLFNSFIIQFNVITMLSMYSVNIFNTFGVPVDSYYATAMTGLARFLGTLSTIFLVTYTGRRFLVFTSISGLGMISSIAALYGNLYLGITKLDNGAYVLQHFGGSPNHSWLPMVCFIVGAYLNNLGMHLLLWCLAGEVFPTEIRGVSIGISSGINSLIGFTSRKTILNLVSALTLPSVLYVYSVIAFLSLVVLYFCLPETEGWSLEEVQEHFAGIRNLAKAGKKKRKNADGEDNPAFEKNEITRL